MRGVVETCLLSSLGLEMRHVEAAVEELMKPFRTPGVSLHLVEATDAEEDVNKLFRKQSETLRNKIEGPDCYTRIDE